MSLAVGIQMDPIESIDIDADSTFALALEAQARGHALFHYLPNHLVLREGRVRAKVSALSVKRERHAHYQLGTPELLDLASLDVILMRQDPPFDMSYITATHILEHIHPKTLVVNDPVEVRNAPEKLFVTKFAGLMPPTLITSDREEVLAFRAEHKDIIVKPLYGNGGAGVFHIMPNDENLGSLLEMFTQLYREPVIVQRYLPEVRKGDKRIILIDGEPVGAINRVPQAGEARSNMHAGGKPTKSELTAREREICAALGPELKQRGMIFVGIDVIGDYLTEINVTSPTGLQEIARFDGTRPEMKIWDAIEARLGRK
jgi:glutathione synthase